MTQNGPMDLKIGDDAVNSKVIGSNIRISSGIGLIDAEGRCASTIP